MTRDRITGLLALLGLVLGGWWLQANTEWVDEATARPARGEARDNPVYAVEQLLRRLGLQVEHHEALDAMPPERARLVLLSSDWALVPERAEQLRRWVSRGGHLVLLQGTDWDDTPLEDWVPVSVINVKPLTRPAAAAAVARAAAAASASGDTTQATTELNSSPPLWGSTPTLAACTVFPSTRKLQAKPGQATAWALTRDAAVQGLRVPVGQGSVTVLNTGSLTFFNTWALRCDNPLLLAAAVQAEPGATAWLYLNEKREALLPWLWHRGWIAIVAGLLALAAAGWRGAVRFGPQLAATPRLRRSISEQVRGLGTYLHREGREALLAAQQRALVEAAARTLPGYDRLPAAERAAAIAAATALPADALSTALSARICTHVQLPPYLQLLESARRRLLSTPQERTTT